MKKVNLERLREYMNARPSIPMGQVEDVAVKHATHEAGEMFTVVSMRNAFLMGQKPTMTMFDEPTTIRHLSYEGGEWMSDSPQEVWQMHEAIELARKIGNGRALVGGLGLGCLSHLLHTLTDGKMSVTTVERDAHIIELVAPHIVCGADVVHSDIGEFLHTAKFEGFDMIVYDTWQSTGETCWNNEVVPLRRASLGIVNRNHCLCWNEKEMLGQIRMGIYKWADLQPDLQNWFSPVHATMRLKCVENGLRKKGNAFLPSPKDPFKLIELEEANREDPVISDLVERLLLPGTSEWENEFGAAWDYCVQQREALAS